MVHILYIKFKVKKVRHRYYPKFNNFRVDVRPLLQEALQIPST